MPPQLETQAPVSQGPASPNTRLSQLNQQMQGAMGNVQQAQGNIQDLNAQMAEAQAQARAQRQEPETRRERLMDLLENFTGAFASGLRGMSEAAPGQRSAGGVAGALQGRLDVEARRRQEDLEDIELARQERLEKANIARMTMEGDLAAAQLRLQEIQMKQEGIIREQDLLARQAEFASQTIQGADLPGVGGPARVPGIPEQGELAAKREADIVKATALAESEALRITAIQDLQTASMVAQGKADELGFAEGSPEYRSLLADELGVAEKMSMRDVMVQAGLYAPGSPGLNVFGDQPLVTREEAVKMIEDFRLQERDLNERRLDREQRAAQFRLQRARELDSESFQQENTLRDDYVRQMEPMWELDDMLQRVISAGDEATRTTGGPNGTTDLALLTSFMKLIDEGSVVRESEFHLAATIGSVEQNFRAWIDRVHNGKILSPQVRQQFIDSAQTIHAAIQTRRTNITNNTLRNVNAYGLAPEHVLIDMDVPLELPDERPENIIERRR